MKLIIELGTNGKGDRNRLKREGRTKEIVKDKLRKAVAELEAGIGTLAESNLIPFIGACKLKELTADLVGHRTTIVATV